MRDFCVHMRKTRVKNFKRVSYLIYEIKCRLGKMIIFSEK